MSYEVKIFDYIPELDAFVSTKEFKEVSDILGLTEWNYVVWIGRFFTRDNDFGEHWFDNWDERYAIRNKAEAIGYRYDELCIIVPSRFQDGQDGPCHTDEERKMFWTDVLKSLTLSLDTIASIAINSNSPVGDEDHITNLKKKIKQLKQVKGA